MFPRVIAALMFLLAFVALALGVLAVAFSSNRGRPSGAHRRPSKASRRATAVALAVVIVGIGLAVPVSIAVTNGNDHAKKGAGRRRAHGVGGARARDLRPQLLDVPHAARGERRRAGRTEPRRAAPTEGAHR